MIHKYSISTLILFSFLTWTLVQASASHHSDTCRLEDYQLEKLLSEETHSAWKLAELDVDSFEECQRECCKRDSCDMLQVEDYSANELICSLFECGAAQSECSKQLIPGFNGTLVAFLSRDDSGKRNVHSNETLTTESSSETNMTNTNEQVTDNNVSSTTDKEADSTSDSSAENTVDEDPFNDNMTNKDTADLLSKLSSSSSPSSAASSIGSPSSSSHTSSKEQSSASIFSSSAHRSSTSGSSTSGGSTSGSSASGSSTSGSSISGGSLTSGSSASGSSTSGSSISGGSLSGSSTSGSSSSRSSLGHSSSESSPSSVATPEQASSTASLVSSRSERSSDDSQPEPESNDEKSTAAETQEDGSSEEWASNSQDLWAFDSNRPDDVTDRLLLFFCGLCLFLTGVTILTVAFRCQSNRDQYQPLA